jgi:hypothetical protein
MSAQILKFPVRECVRVVPARDDEGCWLVLTRGHGWLHGSFHHALGDARSIARGFDCAVVSSAGSISPC